MNQKPRIKKEKIVVKSQEKVEFPTLASLSRKTQQKNDVSPQKIGIMGGSFNPFHNGHIRHALEAMDRLSLSRIELLLSAHHPHKSGLLPFETRLAYLRASIKNIPLLSVNTMEKDLPPPSYTDCILQKWREQNKNAFPYFLLGTEDFSVLKSWHNGFELPKFAHLVIVSRFGGDAKRVCKHAQKYWGNIYISQEEPTHTEFIKNIPCDENTLKLYYQKFSQKKAKKNKKLKEIQKNQQRKQASKETTTIDVKNKKIKKLYIAIPNKGYCTYLHIPHLEISATRIRKLWSKNKSLRGLIADTANTLIQKDTALLKKYW